MKTFRAILFFSQKHMIHSWLNIHYLIYLSIKWNHADSGRVAFPVIKGVAYDFCCFKGVKHYIASKPPINPHMPRWELLQFCLRFSTTFFKPLILPFIFVRLFLWTMCFEILRYNPRQTKSPLAKFEKWLVNTGKLSWLYYTFWKPQSPITVVFFICKISMG